MIFKFVMPGDPPSVNHMYRITQRKLEGGKVRAFMAKTRDAEHFQSNVALLARTAKPQDFAPKGYVYIVYDFEMTRSKDTDNLLKAFNDAIATGIGMNDRWFLPVVLRKATGSSDPKTTVYLFDADSFEVHITPVVKNVPMVSA